MPWAWLSRLQVKNFDLTPTHAYGSISHATLSKTYVNFEPTRGNSSPISINNAISRVWILQTVSERIVELDTNSSLMFGNLRIIFRNLRMSSATFRNRRNIFGNPQVLWRQKSHAFDSAKVGRYRSWENLKAYVNSSCRWGLTYFEFFQTL